MTASITLQSSTPTGCAEDSGLPDHLVGLPGAQWAFWRCIALRGAGFPAAAALKLAAPDWAATADRLIEAEDHSQQALKAAIAALRLEINGADEGRLAELQKIKRRLWKGLRVVSFTGAESTAAAIRQLELARTRVDEAQAANQSAAQAATTQISSALRQVAATELFREAVTWQNRQAIHGSIEALLRMADDSPSHSERQRREELVANYLQRYCVKNDSIGFFGPVCWASFADQKETITVRPGAGLLETRGVYFEGWCIDALADRLAQNKALWPWIAPRRMPFVYLDGTTLYMLLGQPTRLSARQALVLQQCDGERLAREIALDLTRRQASGLKSEEEVYSVLEHLNQRGLISWTFEIPVRLHPERILRQLLGRIEDENLRAPALEALGELENCRGAVARAAGDADKLDESLNSLEETFVRLTGVASTRAAGEMYASRTLVYEDCRRDLEVRIGPEILTSLHQSLSPLLISARWFTHEAATFYRGLSQGLYEELSAKLRSSVVSFSTFWLHASTSLFDPHASPERTILPRFQERWSRILDPPAGERRVEYSSAELEPRVQAAFAAPQAGWSLARYHSPDVMIAAASQEAIQRGDYELVLGELHIGANTLTNSFFFSQHPFPEMLSRSVALDLPEQRLVPVAPKSWPGMTTRTSVAVNSPDDLFLEIARDAHSLSRSQAVPVSTLVVEEIAERLVVRTRDGQLSFDILEVFGELVSGLVVNCLRVLLAADHSPRIKFDRLVISRESWQFRPAEIPFPFEKERVGRFVAARRWARDRDLPRFVFVRAPVEVKPFFVDFDSPTYVDLFARVIRRCLAGGSSDQPISVSEMLPRPDEMWLPDAADQRYTSEFRMVVLDLLKQAGSYPRP